MNVTAYSYSPLERLGFLFYILNPSKHLFETPDDVPDYYVQVVPWFVALVFLEQFLFPMKHDGKTGFRFNDSIASSTQGILQEMARILIRGIQFSAYCYIYDNWRWHALPWNSEWTWLIGFLAVDFGYYCLHRASHEVNILWAAHQVHHSSEDYNMAMALRQSIMQPYSTWIFYLPLALAIPPSTFILHIQLNMLYQFWLHTELVTKLGPLEYILNTPSHHRVHHGRNRYCIDKNFGATLIIWDRLFGTFEAEKEPIAYGLTHPLTTFEPFYIQFFYYVHMWKMFWSVSGWRNKLSVIFKGPGWTPGSPWHGHPEDIPDIRGPVPKYDPPLPMWLKIYSFSHFLITVAFHAELGIRVLEYSTTVLVVFTMYQLYSFVTFGFLLEARSIAPWMELLRCVTFILLDVNFLREGPGICDTGLTTVAPAMALFRFSYIASAILWAYHCYKSISVTMRTKCE